MPPVFKQTHGWVLWRVPRFVRAVFGETGVWATGDDPTAEVYFAPPRLYRLDEIGRIRVWRRHGGEAHVIWCCYDQHGTRFLMRPQPQTISPHNDSQTLILPDDLPPGTEQVRPAFRLTGAFRPFEVKLS